MIYLEQFVLYASWCEGLILEGCNGQGKWQAMNNGGIKLKQEKGSIATMTR